VAEYITKFDEFLVRCGENESDTVALSRFRSGLKEDLRCELFVRYIFTLEQAYQLVQDLNRSQGFSFTRPTNYSDNTNMATIVKSQPSHPSFSSVLDLVTKKFIVSHLDRFNKIDVLSVKSLVTLLYNVRAR